MNIRTHGAIDPEWVGRATLMSEGRAEAELVTLPRMAADVSGLVNGGFVFGLADYAAMLAVNDPNVVLGAAEVRFLAPVALGDVVVATAEVTQEKGAKRVVETEAKVGEKTVFTGTFTTFVLREHVLGAE